MKKLVVALLILPFLTACNTIEGIGKDVESAGKTVKETAEDANN